MKKKEAKHYFQLNLDLTRRPCLLIGGDEEALDKLTRLLECHAKVTLVSPDILPGIRRLIQTHKIRYLARPYKAGDEKGRYFVLNCVKTDPALSKTVYGGCVKRKILISSYDQPKFSMATMASLVRAGKIRISLSSDGSIPAVARALRIEFEKIFDQRFVKFVDWVADYRARMVEDGVSPAERRRRLRILMKSFRLTGTCKYPPRFEGGLSPESPAGR